MIEILEQPSHKCEKCGCVYTFGKEDFNTAEKINEIGIGTYFYNRTKETITYVACPICNYKCVISEIIEYVEGENDNP